MTCFAAPRVAHFPCLLLQQTQWLNQGVIEGEDVAEAAVVAGVAAAAHQ